MVVQEIINNIKNFLADKGVYRTDTFLLGVVNEGNRLLGVLTLYDERRGEVSVSGSRNIIGFPLGMYLPIYVSEKTTGKRLNPVRLTELAFYADEWEGIEDSQSFYYTVLSPYKDDEGYLVIVPAPSGGNVDLQIIGGYIPEDLGLTDTPRLAEAWQDLLFFYGTFGGFLSEPNKAEDAGRQYSKFVQRLNAFVGESKSRFPSGYLFLPRPVEFVYKNITRQQQKQATGEEFQQIEQRQQEEQS